jgi:DNA-binding transcriptional LysR family regulator
MMDNAGITLDQLRVLITVCEAGSFSAAGRALGRVQSAISQSVKTLEEAQGVTLFDRSTHKPTLTAVGEALVEQARAVLASADRFASISAGVRTGLEPMLALAIDPLVPTAPLISSLRALQKKFPDLPVSFSTEGVNGAEQRLRDGTASLAFCLLLPTVTDDLAAHPIMNLRLVAVASAEHPLARVRRKLTRADLEAHVQLVLASSPGAENASYGVLSPRVWRFLDLGRRLDFLLAGFGWCKMPPDLVQAHIDAGRLVTLKFADESLVLTRTLPIYWMTYESDWRSSFEES